MGCDMEEVLLPCWMGVCGELWVRGEFWFQSRREGVGEFDAEWCALLGMGDESEEDNYVEGSNKWCSLFVNKDGELCEGVKRKLCGSTQFLGFFPRDGSGIEGVESFEHVCESVNLVGVEGGGVGRKGVLNFNRHRRICVVL